MSKFGRPLRFGYSPLPSATDPARPLQLAGMAETFGLDYVGIQAPAYRAEDYDLWTLLTAIGMATKSINLFALMPELPHYSPALWARAAASLDLLTNGRVEIAIGDGAAADPFATKGRMQLGKAERSAALAEAIHLMRLMWGRDPSVAFDGKFWQLAAVQPGPAPSRRIGIWLGANQPDDVALAGRLADGWIPNHYPVIKRGDLEKMCRQLDQALATAGRQPDEVQRIWHISGTINDMESDIPFQGSAQQWAESLAELSLELGIDTFLLMESAEGGDAEAQLERFAREVIPATRQLVEPENGVPVASGIFRAVLGAGASGPTPVEEDDEHIDWVDETSMGSFPASDPPGSSSFT